MAIGDTSFFDDPSSIDSFASSPSGSVFVPGVTSGNLSSTSVTPSLIQQSPDSNTFNWGSLLNSVGNFGVSLTSILTRPSTPTTPLVLAPGQTVGTLPNGQPVISQAVTTSSLGLLLLLGLGIFVIVKLGH